MAREAALYGVPGISLFPLELSVDRCLSSIGFPIKRASSIEEVMGAIAYAEKSIDVLASRAGEALAGMEPPQKPLLEILREVGGHSGRKP